jgi:hypothetical protein
MNEQRFRIKLAVVGDDIKKKIGSSKLRSLKTELLVQIPLSNSSFYISPFPFSSS